MRNKLIGLYGPDDHIVSVKIAEELGIATRIVYLIGEKLFIKNETIATSADFELKITTYADQRVGPYGILPLDIRFQEAKQRYKGQNGTSMNHPKVDVFIDCAFEIERQILVNTNLNAEDINDDSISTIIEQLFSYEVY